MFGKIEHGSIRELDALTWPKNFSWPPGQSMRHKSQLLRRGGENEAMKRGWKSSEIGKNRSGKI